MTHVVAVDLGASGGRVILGSWDPRTNTVGLTEIHRFANEPVEVRGTLHWDILRLFHEIKTGIRLAVRGLPPGDAVASLGFDTWGVDFGLLDRKGRLTGNPVHYRDGRTAGQIEKLNQRLGEGELFRRTGIQDAWFNTVGQLTGARDQDPGFFEGAEALLFTPDLLNYFFTGIRAAERTIASTSQLLAAGKGEWDAGLFEALDLPVGLMQPVREPGTLLGPVSAELAHDLGLAEGTPVALVPSHDTESAALAVPSVSGRPFAFISCGTWSVLGAELDAPVLTEEARTGGFSNEAGAFGTTLLLKNIMGLWLLQECKRWWEREGAALDHGALAEWAEAAPAWGSLIDVNHPMFASPGDLPGRIQAFCRQTGQKVPGSRGEILRCVVESLALEFRRSLKALEAVTGVSFEELWLVGGGAKNRLLCRLTAAATGRPVRTGPSETTALGNVVSQLHSQGAVSTPIEARKLVARSFGVQVEEPEDQAGIEAVARRWERILDRPPPVV